MKLGKSRNMSIGECASLRPHYMIIFTCASSKIIFIRTPNCYTISALLSDGKIYLPKRTSLLTVLQNNVASSQSHMKHPDSLADCMYQTHSWKCVIFFRCSFPEPAVILSCLQRPATGTYPKPYKFSSHPYSLLLSNPFYYYYHLSYSHISPAILLMHVFPHYTLMHLSSLPCLPHAPPIQFSLFWSP